MGACLSTYVVRQAGSRYSIKELGDKVGYDQGVIVWRRHDLVLDGAGSRRLHVSYYRQCDEGRKPGTVIFLHGCLADSRDHAAKAQQVADTLRMDAVLVDFGGCGRSGGTPTWGVEEQDDVHRVVAYVNDMRPGEPISFCAFSLGAAVAMMCAGRHANIACMVVDSSFSRLPDAMHRFLSKRLGMRGLSRPLVNWLLSSVKAAHGIDLESVAPVESIRHCYMPVLFLKVEGDDTVPPDSAHELHAAHQGPGAVVTLVGSHNGVRTPEVVDLMLKFVDKHSTGWMARQVASLRSAASSVCSCASSTSPQSASSFCSSSSFGRVEDSFSSDRWYSAWQHHQKLQKASSWSYGDLSTKVAAAAAAHAHHYQQQQQQQQVVSPQACAVCRVSLWQAETCDAWGAKGQSHVRRLSSGSCASVGSDTIPAATTPRSICTPQAAGGDGSCSSRQLPTIRSQMALDAEEVVEEQQQQRAVAPGTSSGDMLVFV